MYTRMCLFGAGSRLKKSEQKDRSKPSGKITVTGRIFTTAVVSFNIPKSGLFADIMHQSIETPPPGT